MTHSSIAFIMIQYHTKSNARDWGLRRHQGTAADAVREQWRLRHQGRGVHGLHQQLQLQCGWRGGDLGFQAESLAVVRLGFLRGEVPGEPSLRPLHQERPDTTTIPCSNSFRWRRGNSTRPRILTSSLVVLACIRITQTCLFCGSVATWFFFFFEVVVSRHACN